MPEEVSPESKLYVKEEIEKSSKEIKEEVEKVNSKATKTFTTVALVVGLVTGLGVYGSATHYISTSIQDKLGAEALAEFEARVIQANQFVIAAKDLVDDANNHVEGAKKLYNDIADIEARAQSILLYKMVIGTIVPYGGEIREKTGEPIDVGEGWLFCNGALVKRNDYPLLYNAIGKAFGAPDPNTFNLPDLRGRFVRGVDHTAGNDPDARLRKYSNKGGNKGDKVGSYQLDSIQTHSHQWGEYKSHHLYSWNKELKPVMALKDQAHNQIPGGKGKKDDYMDVVNDHFWTKPEPCVGIAGTETSPKNVYVNWIIKAE